MEESVLAERRTLESQRLAAAAERDEEEDTGGSAAAATSHGAATHLESVCPRIRGNSAVFPPFRTVAAVFNGKMAVTERSHSNGSSSSNRCSNSSNSDSNSSSSSTSRNIDSSSHKSSNVNNTAMPSAARVCRNAYTDTSSEAREGDMLCTLACTKGSSNSSSIGPESSEQVLHTRRRSAVGSRSGCGVLRSSTTSKEADSNSNTGTYGGCSHQRSSSSDNSEGRDSMSSSDELLSQAYEDTNCTSVVIRGPTEREEAGTTATATASSPAEAEGHEQQQQQRTDNNDARRGRRCLRSSRRALGNSPPKINAFSRQASDTSVPSYDTSQEKLLQTKGTHADISSARSLEANKGRRVQILRGATDCCMSSSSSSTEETTALLVEEGTFRRPSVTLDSLHELNNVEALITMNNSESNPVPLLQYSPNMQKVSLGEGGRELLRACLMLKLQRCNLQGASLQHLLDLAFSSGLWPLAQRIVAERATGKFSPLHLEFIRFKALQWPLRCVQARLRKLLNVGTMLVTRGDDGSIEHVVYEPQKSLQLGKEGRTLLKAQLCRYISRYPEKAQMQLEAHDMQSIILKHATVPQLLAVAWILGQWSVVIKIVREQDEIKRRKKKREKNQIPSPLLGSSRSAAAHMPAETPETDGTLALTWSESADASTSNSSNSSRLVAHNSSNSVSSGIVSNSSSSSTSSSVVGSRSSRVDCSSNTSCTEAGSRSSKSVYTSHSLEGSTDTNSSTGNSSCSSSSSKSHNCSSSSNSSCSIEGTASVSISIFGSDSISSSGGRSSSNMSQTDSSSISSSASMDGSTSVNLSIFSGDSSSSSSSGGSCFSTCCSSAAGNTSTSSRVGRGNSGGSSISNGVVESTATGIGTAGSSSRSTRTGRESSSGDAVTSSVSTGAPSGLSGIDPAAETDTVSRGFRIEGRYEIFPSVTAEAAVTKAAAEADSATAPATKTAAASTADAVSATASVAALSATKSKTTTAIQLRRRSDATAAGSAIVATKIDGGRSKGGQAAATGANATTGGLIPGLPCIEDTPVDYVPNEEFLAGTSTLPAAAAAASHREEESAATAAARERLRQKGGDIQQQEQAIQRRRSDQQVDLFACGTQSQDSCSERTKLREEACPSQAPAQGSKRQRHDYSSGARVQEEVLLSLPASAFCNVHRRKKQSPHQQRKKRRHRHRSPERQERQLQIESVRDHRTERQQQKEQPEKAQQALRALPHTRVEQHISTQHRASLHTAGTQAQQQTQQQRKPHADARDDAHEDHSLNVQRVLSVLEQSHPSSVEGCAPARHLLAEILRHVELGVVALPPPPVYCKLVEAARALGVAVSGTGVEKT